MFNLIHFRLSQKLEHIIPSLGHDVGGRHRQPFAVPRIVSNAGGGLVVEVQRYKLGVVQAAGDEVARGSDRDVVVILWKSE
jgi:hypothetical protein